MRDPRRVIDDLDRQILAVLRDQPRATLSEQADVVGVSRTTLKTRLDRLWDSGLINGHETQLDLAMLGFAVQAWIEMDVLQGELDVVRTLLNGMPEVIEAFATTGSCDLQRRVAARDTDHLQDIVLTLSSCPAISRTRSSVILSSIVNHRKVQALDLLDL